MQISISNAIQVARLLGNSIIRLGLQLWLGFNKSEVIGSEQVVNGGFDTDTDWTLNSGITISGGSVNFTGLAGQYASQDIGVTSAKTYVITYDVLSGSGNLTIFLGGANNIYSSNSYIIGKNKIIATGGGYDARVYFGNLFTGSIDNISIKEISQFAKDKSPNTNNAKLFTGKALSFNGVNDYVDFGSDVNSDGNVWTTAIWLGNYTSSTYDFIIGASSVDNIGLRSSANGKVFFRDANDSNNWVEFDYTLDSFLGYKRLVFTSDGTTISLYVDGIFIDSITPIGTNLRASRLMAGYNTTQYLVQGECSDFQLFDVAWTQDDVTFDYNNPNHLVTDNPNSTIALSNLKGYWALSEGDGSIAYDSSGEGNNGAINGATYVPAQPTIPQLGMMDWSKGSNMYPFSEDFENSDWTKNSGTTITNNYATSPNGDSNAARYLGTGQSGLYDRFILSTNSYTLSFYVKSNTGQTQLCRLIGDSNQASSNLSVTTDWTRISHTFTASASGDNANGIFRDSNDNDLDILIWGAQLEESSTVGNYIGTAGSAAINATLVQAPNNKGFDILGNPLRLREHAFNLDGSGYAEVADDDSLDFGTGDFTIETWLKASYLSGGSTLNSIISLGGAMTDVGSAGIGVYSVTSKFAGYVGSLAFYSNDVFNSGNWYHVVITRDSGLCTMYVDSVAQTNTTTTNANITNSLVKYIGRDSLNTRFYSNLIDETRIYDRYLTQEEITQNYNVGLPAHKNSSSYSDDYSSDYGF